MKALYLHSDQLFIRKLTKWSERWIKKGGFFSFFEEDKKLTSFFSFHIFKNEKL